MKPGRVASLALVILHVSFADETAGESTHTVEITANVPVVAISPQPTDRHFLNLPTLEYRFEIKPQCEAGWQPQSFSLNVADSRVSLTGAELNDRGGKILLRVPARQIAPVPVAGFCVIAEADEGSIRAQQQRQAPDPPRELDIGGALSAHASLVCGSNGARDITYVARPLDVLLSCEAPQPESVALPPGR
jgi:hypothetical protein